MDFRTDVNTEAVGLVQLNSATLGEFGVPAAGMYRESVIQHATGSRGGHRPAVRAAVLIEPSGDVRAPLAETARRNRDPDADGEAPFGDLDHLAWVARHCVPLGLERLAQVPSADLDIPVLGQLAPAQLPLGDALEPGALELVQCLINRLTDLAWGRYPSGRL